MQKLEKIYEGKAKILYTTEDPSLLIQYFKDDATAFNAQKKGTIEQKGVMNNRIAARIFEHLKDNGIATHFVECLNDREMLVKRVAIVPLEVIVRNRAAGSLCRLLGLAEGATLACPTLEFCYKDDALGDPQINEYHIRALRYATDDEVKYIKDMAFRINDILKKFFLGLKIELIDFKLEFGRVNDRIILADEISPDTCRLWEVGTGNKLDKDRFRRDLGNIEGAYQEVLRRVSSH
ncbi:MAG: phosphoribosylaminoimidazolesuccinocarboxamide synthase [Candidatus Omnitrophica bacterium]|nr:phosphoribosylaminoimidazolesuccinocarboxamide synthase [Candidatus Omnitrophota bacterium]MDE2009455.1 phosphoribosylaminoimidazolesuccinocarboxamide synthase [Candidatus Omnitrophota bacterium]MDE2214666.1 phosphoribosylaminoimidazolesuccinocarboxamide synthase [Candidatus Omnitrophota bacterium]MDE2232010.1 phosphoribosylaminoimidazolesuccinocarboxamide synthase [Candidatus Omnitrophota bacterium]